LLRARILEVAQSIIKTGHPPPGYAQGKFKGWPRGVFTNGWDGKTTPRLPEMEDPYWYTESDIWPDRASHARGVERVVVGKMGEVYYTDNHYLPGSWVRIR
jgi:hypothetical protein